MRIFVRVIEFRMNGFYGISHENIIVDETLLFRSLSWIVKIAKRSFQAKNIHRATLNHLSGSKQLTEWFRRRQKK